MAVTAKKDFAAADIASKSGKEVHHADVAATADSPILDTSKKALHRCLQRIKAAKDEAEIGRLTEELQRILFHRQYRNAKN